jgi:hypothetical protein
LWYSHENSSFIKNGPMQVTEETPCNPHSMVRNKKFGAKQVLKILKQFLRSFHM